MLRFHPMSPWQVSCQRGSPFTLSKKSSRYSIMEAWVRRLLTFRHVLWVGLAEPEEQSSQLFQAGVNDTPTSLPSRMRWARCDSE